MSTAIQANEMTADTMLSVVAGGDISRLSPDQKLAYYNARCEAAGLDPRAQPFAFMRLNGKEVLYALKACTDQLAAKHGIVCVIVSQATEDDIRIATVRASAKDGRQTDEIGAVATKGLSGEAMCNAMMKAVTKAKRRAVLSIVGLGMMDETELETVAGAQVITSAPTVMVDPPKSAKPTKSEENTATKTKLLWTETTKRLGPDEAKIAWGAAAARCADGRPSKEWTDLECAAAKKFLSLWNVGQATTIAETEAKPDRGARIAAIREALDAKVGKERATALWPQVCDEAAGGRPSLNWTEQDITAVAEYVRDWKPIPVQDCAESESGSEG